MTRLALAAALCLVSVSALAGDLPDPALTPGLVASTDEAEVCSRVPDGLTYSQAHRQTTEAMKDAVRRAYGIVGQFTGEIDHLEPLCAGGADDVRNLWPQPAEGTWNFHVKDRLEAWACAAVCRHHAMPLAEAQALFVPDWRAGYCRAFPSDERCGR